MLRPNSPDRSGVAAIEQASSPRSHSSDLNNHGNSTSRVSSGLTALVTRLASYTGNDSSSRSSNNDEGPLLNALRSALPPQTTTTPTDIASAEQLEAGLGSNPSTELYNDEININNDTTNDNTNEPGVAEAAARHRLSNSLTVDIRAVARAIEKSLPFIALFLIVFIWAHLRGILLCGYATLVLYRLNLTITHQAVLKDELQKKPLMAGLLLLAVHAQLLYFVLLHEEGPLWKFIETHLLDSDDDQQASSEIQFEFWNVVFVVVVCDLLLRYLLAAIKISILLLAKSDTNLQTRRRSGLITAADYCVTFYRALLPAPFWLLYLHATKQSIGQLMTTAASGVYLMIKAATLVEKFSLAAAAVNQYRGASYGETPSADDLAAAPRECAICQDDIRRPLQLSCRHIFCEDCVEEWLQREPTCPMCRSVVRKGAVKQLGDGSTTLVPMLA